MAILYVAVLYSTVDVESFYKTSGNIFPMQLYIAKYICDASEPLCIRDFTQLG